MCSWDALVQMLRFLKRGFWPAAWDFDDSQAAPGAWTGGSGFMGAAQVPAMRTEALFGGPTSVGRVLGRVSRGLL